MEKHRQSNNGRENFVRSKSNPQLSYDYQEKHESTGGNRRGYRRRGVPLQKGNRGWTRENLGLTAFEEKKETNNRKVEQRDDFTEDNDDRGPTSNRYREYFETRPNNYEFNDEEYLKPRPRKRRPPQNYEFALSENEMSSMNEKRPATTTESHSGTASGGGQFVQNTMELKSLLKMQQEEGLSLSEVLQRRNLTLDDLLKGKTEVINALKMKDVEEEEGEDYVEEAIKIMSNSLSKLSTTTKRPVKLKNFSKDEEQLVISIVPTGPGLPNNHTNVIKESSSSGTSIGEMYSEAGENRTAGKSIFTNAKHPRNRATTMITTSMPPVATNSMELLQADDAAAAVKLQSSGEIKAENLDQDEIMEFSDFTDYKKGQIGASPVWLTMQDESSVEHLKIHFEDTTRGSTLSIEKILSTTTERSNATSNFSIISDNEEQFTDESINSDKGVKFDDEEEQRDYYDTSSEKEYQRNTPTMMYYDFEQNTQIGSSIDKTIIQEIKSALDAISENGNVTVKNHESISKEPPPKNHQDVNTSEEKSYDDVVSEVEPEARADIFELLTSGSAGRRLERLLKSRNMSLEELIALRQRGFSKVHLADVSRIRAHKLNDEYRIKFTTPLPSNENHLRQSTESVTSSSDPILKSMNFVHPEESKTERLFDNLEKSRTSNEDDAVKENEKDDIVEERHRTVQIVDLLTTFGSLPFAKDIQRDFAGEYNNEDERKLSPVENNTFDVVFVKDNTETILGKNDTSNVIQSGFVKEVVKQEPSSVDIQTVYSEMSNVFDKEENSGEKGRTLSKVKPSIIASGAILSMTLVVFLAIFIICRIRQKRKYRYRNTFSRAVFQGPVMAARKLSNSSSLSTVMVNVVATSTTKRSNKVETQEPTKDGEMNSKIDIDNDSLDANDSWETIPDYMK
ncbi:hypothetical protein WH47_08717 [Habropoda laboriosa]|uniref:Uncharacterized protein n=1 Tax=Habropoda laboriosa TaxID=597456 RepID=A0A0L7QP03_9HYME|nr:hypothetical protein WH47_08717 [Habropoda laboriosa]